MDPNPPENASERPNLHQAQTFPRMDDSTVSPFARSRARSVQSVPTPEAVDSDAHPLPMEGDEGGQDTGRDVFDKRGSSDSDSGDEEREGEEFSVLSRSIHEQPEELPVELMSLTDR